MTLSAASRVGAWRCCTSGALDMMYSIICAALESRRRRRVVAAIPCRIVPDRVHGHRADHAVATGDLRRHAGERREAVHELRVRLAPHPAVHAPHRRAHDEPQVVHAKLLASAGDAAPRPCRRRCSAGTSREARHWACSTRHDRCRPEGRCSTARVEQLARAEQLARVRGTEEAPAGAARPVQDHHGVPHDAAGILPGRAQRRVVQAKLRKDLTGRKAEVAHHVITLAAGARPGVPGALGGHRCGVQQHQARQRPGEPDGHRTWETAARQVGSKPVGKRHAAT